MAYHTLTIPHKARMQMKGLDAVPSDKLYLWSMRLFALMNLTWDYVATICDLCALYRYDGTKSASRELRNLKREYDSFRWSLTGTEHERSEARQGASFERVFSKDFSHINKVIMDRARQQCAGEGERLLFTAVHQALILMGAVKRYARWCDKWIKSYGAWVCDCCMVQTEFLKLYPVIGSMLPKEQRWIPGENNLSLMLASRLHLFGRLRIIKTKEVRE